MDSEPNEIFYQALLKYGLSDETSKDFSGDFELIELPRKSIITREGQVENYFYFVVEGIQRSVFVKDGKEHVVAFTYPGQVSGVPDSFLSRLPSPCNLETTTPSTLLRLHHDRFQEWLAKSHELTTFFLRGYDLLVRGTIERHYELLAYSMEERFARFYERSKHLINLIPRKDIASYLNMDPTNLSKLMAKLK